MRSEARSIRSDSRSRLAESELSNAALDRMARQAAALALGPASDGEAGSPTQPAAAGGSRLGPGAAAADGAAAGQAAAAAHQQQHQQHPPYERELTLSYPRDGQGEIPVERSAGSVGAGAAQARGDSLTFRPGGAYEHGPPESDVATRGSLHGSGGAAVPPHGAAHHRTASAGSVGGPQQRSVHYKSLSADSRGARAWLGRRLGRRLEARRSSCRTQQVLHHFCPKCSASACACLTCHRLASRCLQGAAAACRFRGAPRRAPPPPPATTC